MNSIKKFEVEIRGRLDKLQVKKLKDFLNRHAKLISDRHRVLVDYTTLMEGNLRDRKKDIRIRTTNGQAEIIIKLGAWGNNESREEVTIPVTATFDHLAYTMHLLGYSKGILAVRNSSIYEYKNVEIAIVEVPTHSYYFEVEQMVADGGQAHALKYLHALCIELGLRVFEGDEYYLYIEQLNKEANEVYDAANAEPNFFERNFKV